MNRSNQLTDELIRSAFELRAGRAGPGDLRANILTLTVAAPQRGVWRLRLTSSFSKPVLRPAWIAILILTALLAAAVAVALVGQRPHFAHHGLLAYIKDGDVYFANADGSDAVRAVHDQGVGFRRASWSPDGRWLALETGDGEYLLDPGTHALRRVATGRDAVWSSDSQSLAFIVPSNSGDDPIKIVGVDTAVVRKLPPHPGTSVAQAVAWSPDGRWLLASTYPSACHTGCQPGGSSLMRIDAATGDAVVIAPVSNLVAPAAHWSPDSRRFAYARSDPACIAGPPCSSTIVVEDADLSHAFGITDPAKLSSDPIWSPDGGWIAYLSAEVPGPSAAQRRGGPPSALSIMRSDGRGMRTLVAPEAIGGSVSTFSWSPDGSAIDLSGFDSTSGTLLGVSEVRIDDGVMKAMSLPQGLDSYDWQAIPAGRPVPALAKGQSAASSPATSIAPWPSPPAARPADPSGSWSGIALDAYCDAAVLLDFRTLAHRTVESACPDTIGYVVFAPQGAAYALPAADRSVTVVRRDGSTTKVLGPRAGPASGGFGEVELAWSPDGRWLAVHRCVTDPTGHCINPEYLVVSADGRSQHQVPVSPSWSPDGRRLVVEGPNGALLTGSPDGLDLRSIGKFPMPSGWSPDATRFAFVRDGDAWIVGADGTNERNVTHFAHGGAGAAVWSPDGKYIAVGQESQLWIVRPADGDLHPIDLGNGRGGFYNVVWSPDSSRLALVIGPGETPATLIFRTADWTATFLGSKGIESVGWSPEGRFMSLIDTSATVGAIDIANGDGTGRHTVWNASDSAAKVTWVP